MKRCNCGEIMQVEDPFGYPKIFWCPSCNGTLQIFKGGIQRWFDVDGNPATYTPSKEKSGKED